MPAAMQALYKKRGSGFPESFFFARASRPQRWLGKLANPAWFD
jgi:hypothetical protein